MKAGTVCSKPRSDVLLLTDGAIIESGDDFGLEVRTQFAEIRDQKSAYQETLRQNLTHCAGPPIQSGGSL
jgi:hypothetical protein